MEPQARFSLWYYIAIFIALSALQSLFFSGSAGEQITYSEFLKRISDGKVESVVLTKEMIFGLMRAPKEGSESDAKQPEKRKGGDKKSISPPLNARLGGLRLVPGSVNTKRTPTRPRRPRLLSVRDTLRWFPSPILI